MSALPPWDTLIGWVTAGQDQVVSAAAGLAPAQLRGPSRLPSWSRGHVLSHLARNADALANLLSWARTGTETRMYSSPAERDAGISAGARRDRAAQLADLTESGARFLRAAGAVPVPRRSFPVISGQGRRIPAHEVPWLRVREVWLHLVDLDAGYGIDAVPDAIAWALTRDVAAWLTARVRFTVDLHVDGHGTVRLGPGEVAAGIVSGRAGRVAGWLTGRAGPAGLTGTDGLPDLPRWL